MRNPIRILLLIVPVLLVQLKTMAQNPLEVKLKTFYDSIKNQPHYRMSPDELKKIPKYDRPDLAAEQDFYMTVNPNTLTVPAGQNYKVMEQVAQLNSSPFQVTGINGVSWNERGPNNFGGRTRALLFDPTDSVNGYKKVWAGGVAGGLWYTNDVTAADSPWHVVNDFWPNMAVTCMASDPTNDSVFYVGTGEGYYNADAVRGKGLWKTTDAGATWNQLSSTDNSSFYYNQKIAVTSSGRVIVATRSGLYRSDSGGTSWTTIASGRYSDIEIAQNGDIYATKGIFNTGVIYKSTNGGTSFSIITPSGAGTIQRIELACAPSDSNVLYAVAQNGGYDVAWMKKSLDGGTSWTNMTIPKYQNDTTRDFCRSQTWYDLILAVHPTNPYQVIAGGIDLHKTTDSGATWIDVSHWYGGFGQPYVHADQHNIVFRPGVNNEAIFSNDGGVYYSSDIGSSSSPSFGARVKNYNVTQFYSVAMKNDIGSNYYLAGAQDNGSHKFTSAGINSTVEVTGGDGAFCFIDQDDPDYQITSYVRNNWRRSTNGGTSFSAVTSNNSGRFINPADYDNDADILYAAAGNNQVYRVSGISGTISTSTLTVGGSGLGGADASALTCSPYNSNVVFVGTDVGNIYKVSNANGSPTSINLDTFGDLPTGYMSCIEVGENDSQLLVTFSNYGVNSVWETKDGGASWTSKEGNLPDMPVRWALYNPNNREEVLLATEVGVWSTNSLSASSVVWDPSNSGLANVRCDMLQIRSSDLEVAVATHGRGMFTSNVFADTTVVADFSVSDSLICSGNTIRVTNNSRGKHYSYRWRVTGGTSSFVSGTDSTSENPIIQLNDTVSFTIRLIASDSLGNSIDTLIRSQVVKGIPSIFLNEHIQNFDAFAGVSGNTIDSIWTIENLTSYKWAIDSNNTTSVNTGPIEDYSGTGKYLFGEASSPAAYLNEASIYTQCLALPDTGFFFFGYHMYGANIGELRFAIDTGAGWQNQVVYSGQQQTSSAEDWKQYVFELSKLNGKSAKFKLTTVRGLNWDSDIAIDELSFVEEMDFCNTIITSTVADASGCDSVLVTFPLPNYLKNLKYNWGIGGTDSIGSFDSTGTWNVTVTDNSACSTTTSFNVNIQNTTLLDLGNDTSGCISLRLHYPGYLTYSWSTGDTTSSIQVDSSQLLILTITDSLGCGSATDSIQITIDTSLTKAPSCKPGVLSTSFDDGIYGVRIDSIEYNSEGCDVEGGYLDRSCSGFEVPDSNFTLEVDAGKTYTNRVRAYIDFNNDGSFDTLTEMVMYSSKLAGYRSTTVNIPSGAVKNSYLRMRIKADDDTAIANNPCSDLEYGQTEDFYVYIWDQACSISNVSLGNDTSQCGGSVALNPGAYSSYIWNSGDTTQQITVSTSGSYSVTVTDSAGCSGSDTVIVSIFAQPTVDLGPDTSQCGGSITLDAGSFSVYSWSNGDTTQTTSISSTGTYTVYVEDANGCWDLDTIDVTINSTLSFSLGLDTSHCGTGLILNAGNYSNYSWSTGDTTSKITVDTSGNYSVTVTNVSGCQASDTIQVTINTLPTVSLGNDTTQCGGSITLDAGSFSSYSWSTGATSSTISVSTSGSYNVLATDANGCQDRDTSTSHHQRTTNSQPWKRYDSMRRKHYA
jgi:hypothetical protein